MSSNKKSSRLSAWKALYVIPLVGISLAVSAETKFDYRFEEPSAVVENFIESPQQDQQDQTISFNQVEQRPSFNGGDANSFAIWVAQNIKYPEEAKKKNLSGRVILQFTVGKDGVVKNVKVLRGIDPLLDAEAVRAVSSSPKWTPGKHKGKAVAVAYTFPISFGTK